MSDTVADAADGVQKPVETDQATMGGAFRAERVTIRPQWRTAFES
jgi:hypothetical protein